VRLTWLELAGFRTYDALRWEPEASVNVLVGPNAIGKTNVLEAVGYLATLRSFRGVPDSALVRTGAPGAVVRGEIDRGGSEVLIEVELPADGRRRAQVNHHRLGRVGDLLGHVRSVAFLPDDIDIVKRGPGYRRDLIDSVAVQIWPVAYADQQDYDKVLRQRNSLLRQMGRDPDAATLSVWDERLSEAGARVMARRQATLDVITGVATDMYQRLANEPTAVTVDYRSTWGSEQASSIDEWRGALAEALAEAHRADMDRRVTTVGPHRDDPIFRLDERDSRTHASQGEQRTLILALRLASHQAITDQVGEPPLLLLDDVFSELDPARAAALSEALPEAQTFITTARDEEVPVTGKRWVVGQGVLG
jgi:DNA replication and repair protein RecF